MDDLIGRQLGNYRIESILGRGGMAVVYRGWDVTLDRPAAVKVIDARYRDSPDYAERFAQEARVVATWRHEHIAQVYYAGQEEGLYFFAMEYIDGEGLGKILARYKEAQAYMPYSQVLHIVRAVAAALDYAHQRGVIHRDVKPSNVVLAADGRVVLTDFGLSLHRDRGTKGEVLGSPQYISPEQAVSSADVVPQSDLYSLGTMVYEMVTGWPLFPDAAGPFEVALAHVHRAPPPPRDLRPEIGPELENVLLKALAKRAEERYPTGAALAAALEQALEDLPASPEGAAPLPGAGPAPGGRGEDGPSREGSEVSRPSSYRPAEERADWQGTAFVLWTVGAVAALFFLRHPLGREALASPGGGFWVAVSIFSLWLGWTLGWKGAVRLLGLLVAGVVVACTGWLRPGPTLAAVLQAALPLPLYLWGAVAGRALPRLRLPEVHLPRVSLAFDLLRPPPAQDGPTPPPCEGDMLPGWADRGWSGAEGREAALEETSFPAEEGLPLPGPAAPLETLPHALGLDPAVLLAETVLALLQSIDVTPPPLQLESGSEGIELEVGITSRRQGKMISEARPHIEEAIGATYGETLQGHSLRLSFPPWAQGRVVRRGPATLWVPLGRTPAGRRLLTNLACVGPLFLVGEDRATIAETLHAILAGLLAGRLNQRLEVLLAEGGGHYFDRYSGVARVYRGGQALDALKRDVLERCHEGADRLPPAPAIVAFPAPDRYEQVATLVSAGPPVGVYPIVALDTPAAWETRCLVASADARLVFQVGEAESRFYLGRLGAQDLGDYRAIFHLAGAMREPQVLATYATSEEEVQEMLAALGQDVPAGP